MRYPRTIAILAAATLMAAACGGGDEPASETVADTVTSEEEPSTGVVEQEPADTDASAATTPATEPEATAAESTEPAATEPADDIAELAEAGQLDIDLVDCEQMAIVAAVPPDQASTLAADAALFLDDDGMANFTHVAKSCTDMVVDGASFGPGHFDTAWIRTVGPEDIREFPEYPDHMVLPGDLFVPVAFTTDNEAFADAVSGFGVPIRLADSMEMDPIDEGLQTGAVEVDGVASSWATDNVAPGGRDVYFVHVLEDSTDGLEYRYDITCPATVVYFANPSTMRLGEGSPPAEAFGSEVEGVGFAVDLTCDVTIDRTLVVEATLDVPYTASKTLDVYAPATGEGWPAVLFFHGGNGTPRDEQVVATAQGVASRGVSVFVPQWASGGPAGGSEDTVCALAFVESAAEDFRGDPDRVTISGFSTGGFTAAVHALTADDPPLGLGDCSDGDVPALPDAAVPGGTPFFAVDAARAGMFAANPQWNTLTPEQLDAIDPYLLLGRNPEIDMVLVVGRDDVGGGQLGEIPIAESNREYHAALREAGYDAELVELDGGHELVPGTPKFEQWVTTIATTAAGT